MNRFTVRSLKTNSKSRLQLDSDYSLTNEYQQNKNNVFISHPNNIYAPLPSVAGLLPNAPILHAPLVYKFRKLSYK